MENGSWKAALEKQLGLGERLEVALQLLHIFWRCRGPLSVQAALQSWKRASSATNCEWILKKTQWCCFTKMEPRRGVLVEASSKESIDSTSSSSAWDCDSELVISTLWGFSGGSWKDHQVSGLARSLTWTMCLGRVLGPESRQTVISFFRDASDAALPQFVLLDPLQECSGIAGLWHPTCHP